MIKMNKFKIIFSIMILVAAIATNVSAQKGIVFFGGNSEYEIMSFTNTGTGSWVVPKGVISVEALVVAGGGGGGSSAPSSGGGGGGGAGGLKYVSSFAVTEGQTITVVVGAGGAPGATGGFADGSDGGNSSFGTLVATGGGGGARSMGLSGRPGGSGGGGGYNGYSTIKYGGSGVPGQGNSGGNTSLLSWAGGAGGGGAGGAGGDNKVGHAGGDRGPGLSYSITGSPVTYSVGGGGGVNSPASSPANSGNGGDAAYSTGTAYAGGSGIVVIKYSVSPKIQAAPLQSGLVGHWSLDSEDYNFNTARVTDKTPFENHGTNYGASPATDRNGKVGGAMSFNGSSYIEITNPINQPNLEQEWTASAWVDIDDKGSQNLILGINNGLMLTHGNSNNLLLYLNSGVNDYYVYGDSTGLLEGQGWRHVVFTFRNSDGLRKIYINGDDHTGSGPNKTFTPKGINSLLTIGNGAKGKIDDVRIYNRALSEAEIKSLYDKGR